MIQYSVGMSLGPSSSVESGVAVREIATGKLIYVDKLFSMSDVQLFFDNYSSIQNSVFCISLPWDNWMQRFAPRGSELFMKLKEEGADISRFEVYLTRQKFNLYSNFKERSSADCKFLQSALKYEYNFDSLPANMMPVAQLEAIVGCLLGEEKLKNNTGKIFEFRGLDVINL